MAIQCVSGVRKIHFQDEMYLYVWKKLCNLSPTDHFLYIVLIIAVQCL